VSEQDELLDVVIAMSSLRAERETASESRIVEIDEELESLSRREEELQIILGPEGCSGLSGYRGGPA